MAYYGLKGETLHSKPETLTHLYGNQQPKNLLAQGRQATGDVVPVRYLTQGTYP